jgi:hypothetical protein
LLDSSTVVAELQKQLLARERELDSREGTIITWEESLLVSAHMLKEVSAGCDTSRAHMGDARRDSFPAPDAAHGGEGALLIGAAHFPVVVIAMAGRGRSCGPHGALLASLVAVSDIALGVANCVVGWLLLVTARGCLPASLCGLVHDLLVVGGVLGGDAL